MKRNFALWVCALLCVVLRAAAQSPDDQYLRVYSMIQAADQLVEQGRSSQALSNYIDAHAILQKFQRAFPEWNPDVVKFRLDYLGGNISRMVAKQAEAAPAQPPATQAEKPEPEQLAAQLNNLRNQVAQLQNEKGSLEAKLKEALAAQPAALDPAQLAKAEERIKALQKDNDLLNATLSAQKEGTGLGANTNALAQARQAVDEANRQLASEKESVARLNQEKEALQARVQTLSAGADTAALVAENELLKKQLADLQSSAGKDSAAATQLAQARAELAVAQSDKEVLRVEKQNLEKKIQELTATPSTAENPRAEKSRMKALERERDDLRKQLAAANKELNNRKSRTAAARIKELQDEAAALRARVQVFETARVPYSAEELAMMRKPEPQLSTAAAAVPVAAAPAVAAPATSEKKPAVELPADAISLIAEARRDFSNKEYDKAEEKYRQVLKQTTNHPPAMADLAMIQLQGNRLDDAEKTITEALKLAPDNAYALSVLGQIRFRQNRLDDAIEVLGRAAELDPKNAEIQNWLGVTLGQKGMRGPAEAALRKAVQLQPGYAQAHNNLAVVYAYQKPPMIELARWHYRKALAGGLPPNPELEKKLNEGESSQ